MPSKKLSRHARPGRGPPPRPDRFIADAMLGSLARKLRAFGFDTIYYKDGDDPTLLSMASREERVILTSDRALSYLSASKGVRSVLIEGGTEGARLSSLRSAARAGRIRLERGQPRCSVCNEELERMDRSKALGRVPAEVSRRHRVFYGCESCGRVYWKGSHWKKLRLLQKRLVQNQHAIDS